MTISKSLLAAALLAASTIAANATTVTFTNSQHIHIPRTGTEGNASPYPSTITVSGILGLVTDVNVIFHNLSHSFSADLDIRVQSALGTWVTLMDDQGGGADWSHDTLTFSDGGAILTSALVGNSGTFNPLNPLSAFNGQNPNGVWGLYVFDQYGLDRGQMQDGWSVEITYTEPTPPPSTVPVPASLPLLAGGLAALGTLVRRRRKSA